MELSICSLKGNTCHFKLHSDIHFCNLVRFSSSLYILKRIFRQNCQWHGWHDADLAGSFWQRARTTSGVRSGPRAWGPWYRTLTKIPDGTSREKKDYLDYILPPYDWGIRYGWFLGMIVLIILDCNLSFHIQTITLTLWFVPETFWNLCRTYYAQ